VTDLYEPRIDKLLEKKEGDWGDPRRNQMSLVSYGIEPLDKALYGINVSDGELILISGQQKRRKTTFFLNILVNMFTKSPAKDGFSVCVDVLESGMTVERYRDQLLAIVASKFLLRAGHIPVNCPKCTGKCKEMRLNPEFFRYHDRTKEQRAAIEAADQLMSTWPLFIFGSSYKTGNTRDINESIIGKNVPEDSWHVRYGTEKKLAPAKELRNMSRWQFLKRYVGTNIYGTDHLQQYRFGGRDVTDYEKQVAVIPIMSDWVVDDSIDGKRNVVFLISQVSVTSTREARQNMGRPMAAGGNKAGAEANVSFSTQYNLDEKGYMWIVIEESRRAQTLSVKTGLEDISGCFWGDPIVSYKREFIG
jgi:hypothetical protein